MSKRLILASNSPRRKEILTNAGFNIEIIPSTFEEVAQDLSPTETVKNFAFNKAKEVFERLNDSNAIVVGADTVVSLDNVILGKPKDRLDATNMLKNLSGKTHQVYTGYCIYSSKKVVVDAVKSEVTFNPLTDQNIDLYVASGKPMDKAGAYGIQDGYGLIKGYKGSYNNVVGLPIEDIKPIIKSLLD